MSESTTDTTQNTHYIVQTASARVPSTCMGQYRKVAVLKVPAGVEEASMISERSKDVLEVVHVWDRLNVGKTDRCAYQIALRQARRSAARLNAIADTMAWAADNGIDNGTAMNIAVERAEEAEALAAARGEL